MIKILLDTNIIIYRFCKTKGLLNDVPRGVCKIDSSKFKKIVEFGNVHEFILVK